MTSVPPKSLAAALEHVRNGGRLAVPTYTRVTIIDRKALDRWEKIGRPLLRERDNGYQMCCGRGSVYLMPGQLKMID